MRHESPKRFATCRVLARAAGMVAVVAAAHGASIAAQSPRQSAAGHDRKSVAALLDAAAGTYTVTASRLGPASAQQAVPLLVQADARRAPEGRVRVSLALSAELQRDWTVYVRVLPVGGAPDSPAPAEQSESGPAGQVRVIREFTLEPGSFEASVALVRRGSRQGLVGTVVRRPLPVPDVWKGSIAAAPVVLGDGVAAARPEEAELPFVFGPTRLTPALGNRFRQDGDLHVALRVYNWKAGESAPPDRSARPDLKLEYVFHQQMGKSLRFFNKLKPQLVNAESLGSGFDGASGAVATGMSIPLAAFPPGEFELSVRILDARTRASVTQKVRFTVVA